MDFRVRVGFRLVVGDADNLNARLLGAAIHPRLERNGYNRLADMPNMRLIGISARSKPMSTGRDFRQSRWSGFDPCVQVSCSRRA